jgi:hypothetical protein
MRFWRRRPGGGSARDAAGPVHEQVEHRAPSSALTGWLRQGLSAGMCPLCRVAHKADREYIWQFYDERSNDDAVIEQVSRAFGFCAEHVEMLRRIDIESMKSTLALGTMFAQTFSGIVDELDQADPTSPIEPQPCPACAARNAYLEKNALLLFDLLATSPGHLESFRDSPGLCFPHFKLAWDLAPSRADRDLLLGVQRSAARSLLDELREHVRKQDHKFAHEPKGAEQDSWLRAIFLTAGWPAPTASAAEPEERD